MTVPFERGQHHVRCCTEVACAPHSISCFSQLLTMKEQAGLHAICSLHSAPGAAPHVTLNKCNAKACIDRTVRLCSTLQAA